MDGALQCVRACSSVVLGQPSPLASIRAFREELEFQRRITPGLWLGFAAFVLPLLLAAGLIGTTVYATRAMDEALYGSRFRPIKDGSAGQMIWDPATGRARIEGEGDPK